MRYGLKRRGISDKAKRRLVKAYAQERSMAEEEGRTYTPEARQSFFRRQSDELEVSVDVIRRHCEPEWTQEQTDFYTDKYLDLGSDDRVKEKRMREWARQTGVDYDHVVQQVGHKPKVKRKRTVAKPQPKAQGEPRGGEVEATA